MLANILKQALPFSINKYQTVVINARFFGNNSRLVYDIINETKTKLEICS